ncbi:hypothetical protein WJX74_001068 [Apatococcus lobatus]|uniref:Uncharacterized protein n=2 Tax=Apatococcus TaxID=904362 RepID=A0AAW1T2N8_9CHLO
MQGNFKLSAKQHQQIRRAGSEIVQEAVQGASSGSLTERLTSGVFFLAVITLGIISLGVLYLSLSQFIDSRNEKSDLSKWTPEERNAKGPAVKQQQQRSTKRKQYVSAKGGGKGFGDFGDGDREF